MKLANLKGGLAAVTLAATVLAACGAQPAAPAATTAPAAPAATTAPAAPAATTAPAAPAATAAPAAPAATTAPAAPTADKQPGVLRMALGAEPDNTDPQKASFVAEIQQIMLNYMGLMTFDTDMKPIPGQAESVEVSPDGLVYTFKMRPNSKYSNGDPLTAQNYEFAWKRLADPEVAGEYQFIGCDVIKGFTQYAVTTCADAEGNTKTITEAQALDLAALREGVGVKATDDNTLVITLEKPAPYFLSMAALWIGAPTREADAEQGDNLSLAVPENFVGNGPFRLVKHEPDAEYVYEANPNYNGPNKPILKGLEFKVIKESAVAFQAYKNGELDLIGLPPEDKAGAQADPVLSKELVPTTGSCTFYLGFNLTKAPFDNQKVREAFAQAFDREAFVRDVLAGEGAPTQTFIPPGFPGHDANGKDWPFDPAAAKAKLAEAGFPNGQGIPEVKLTYSSSARNKVRFEWVANQIKTNLGITPVLDPVDPTAYTALTKSKETQPQMFYLGWCADYPDPQNFLTVVFKTGGIAAGRISYSNPEFDKLVDQADVEKDTAKRAELYAQAQSLLIKDVPVVFTSNDGGNLLVKPYVTGLKATPIDYIPGYFSLATLNVE